MIHKLITEPGLLSRICTGDFAAILYANFPFERCEKVDRF